MPKEYTVGYRKPPKATRFKPGQSGNPKGRPKGSPNLAADLSTELGELITVREGGAAQRVSKQRALIKPAPIDVAPSRNATEPVAGVEPPFATVAAKVTAAPYEEGFGFAVTDVVVVYKTCCIKGADVLAKSFASPP